MIGHWPLVLADFRREYQLTGDGLAALSLQEFLWLLRGLSTRSRFMQTYADTPKHMHDPADRAALIAAARR